MTDSTDTTPLTIPPGTPYRGHRIVKESEGNFAIHHGSSFVTRCGTHWSCVCYIDEKLQP